MYAGGDGPKEGSGLHQKPETDPEPQLRGRCQKSPQGRRQRLGLWWTRPCREAYGPPTGQSGSKILPKEAVCHFKFK